jgi:hypothetical protein
MKAMSVFGPSLQIAAIGVGSRFGGTADVSQRSIALQSLPDFDGTLAPVFRYKKKVRPAADVG